MAREIDGLLFKPFFICYIFSFIYYDLYLFPADDPTPPPPPISPLFVSIDDVNLSIAYCNAFPLKVVDFFPP